MNESASEGNINQPRLGCNADSYFSAEEATSFWKRRFLRSGSTIGSSRSNPKRRVRGQKAFSVFP
jgi:hypothetical protein